MARPLAATGGPDRATASPSAARAAAGDERAGYGEEVGLGACDGAPRLLGGVAGMPRTGPGRGAPQAASRGAAGAPSVSGDTMDALLASATPGRAAACTATPGSETARRDRAKGARPLRQAGFPVPRAPDAFDRPDAALPDGWGRDGTCSLAFARDAGDLASRGRTGRGRAHMATALGIAAASAGHPAGLWQAARPVPRLGKARGESTPDGPLADVARARPPVLGESGCAPLDAGGAGLPCQVTSESYEGRGATSAADAGSGRWGTALADGRPAAAVVGRVARHGRPVGSGGPSHRPGEGLMLGKPGRWGRRRARDETRRSLMRGPERNPRSKPKVRLD
ncbi:ATP-binding protein [Olsenella sp. Marseille-P4559]|uniref:ATP-binding protein n=1 Tax=Olsenella sp. Marseille-P4559 TaxID=2364795 RepID=UPI00352E5D41